MKIKKIIITVIVCFFTLTGCTVKNTSGKKILRIATNKKVNTLDSSKANDDTSYTVIRMFTEGLYDFNRSHKISKRIASKHSISSDGLTHTFTIKKTAKWSNGDDVTADDFIYAWKRALYLHTPNSYYFTSAGIHLKGANEIYKVTNPTIESLDQLAIKKITSKKFRITLTEKSNELSYLLSLPVFYPINYKFARNCGDKYATDSQYLLSNSMYELKNISKNKLILNHNKKYINKDAGNVEKIIFTMNQSSTKSIKQFKQNKIDYTQINLKEAKAFKNKDVLIKTNENRMIYLTPNLNNVYLKNKSIREAISLAINRKYLVEKILDNNASIATGIIPSNYYSHQINKKNRSAFTHHYHYSNRKAKNLLKKELKDNKINLELVYSDHAQIARYLKKSIDKTKAIKIRLKKVNNIDEYLRTHDFALALTSFKPTVNNCVEFLNYLQDGFGLNYGHYNSNQFNSLVSLRNTGFNDDSRYYITSAAESQAVEDMALIPLVQSRNFYLMSTKIQTMGDNSIGHYPTYVPDNFTYTIIK